MDAKEAMRRNMDVILVVAWVEPNQVLHVGPSRSIGGPPRVIRGPAAHAATWRIGPNSFDRVRASEYVATLHGGRVFEYPTDEPDPLARARTEVMSSLVQVAP